MSKHLAKAKAALDAARVADAGPERSALIDIALVQATVAQAEALDRIATILSGRGRAGVSL